MKPTTEIILLSVTLIAIALLADAWHSARRDSQQLAATLVKQNTAIQQASERQNQRDSQLATTLATIQAEKRTVRTPQQAASRLNSVLPPLPLPVSISSPYLSPLPASAETQIPPTSISIPQPDLIPLYDAMQDCRANTARNDAMEKDLADEKLRSGALQRERDAAVKMAHGGSIVLRVKRAAKWFVIGLAAGAVAASAAHR